MSIESVVAQRVREPLIDERVFVETTASVTIMDTVGPEEWRVYLTKGKSPPFGAVASGRITIGPLYDPIAGLIWSVEHGRKYVHTVWVDREARGRGVGEMLIALYKRYVSRRVVMSGPFTAGGRALAEKVGAKIINDEVAID